jgi:RecA-family ATPase
MSTINLIPLLDYIDAGTCTYEEWVQVGMALKVEGYSADDWDSWSAKDSSRYHKGECQRKWSSFKRSDITGATITELAKRSGWKSPAHTDKSFSWDDIVGDDSDYVIVDSEWIEGAEIAEPSDWNPVKDITAYLSALFDSTDVIGYVTDTWEKDGKYLPTKGIAKKTAGEIINKLGKCNGDLSVVFGDFNPDAGAWVRFNPLDGKGVSNDNVTQFNYALVESDSIDVEKQYAIMQKLELPIAALVHSGNKSLHAIVHIDAGSYDEYRKRVDYLYDICTKNGLEVDRGNKNPSRLSRMPGVMRGGKKQFLVATNIGKADFSSWRDWVEEINDNLPDIEHLADEWNHMPDLSPELIQGVLRCGHKMLLAGPSKAGKSFALIELVIAIAEGKMWMGFPCKIGRILYVNLELDRASCLHRFKDVYEKLGIRDYHISNVDIWNLRGKSVPMDKLAPKLIRRAQKGNYIAIVIDPIYKIITGDENSADQMAHFCNQFDKVCTELGCAVIYCHHHSKGAQGGKRSMDRASGSGVFARDPDALIDMIQLAVDDEYGRTGWRLEGTLREFKAFDPINVYFDYPVHVIDQTGTLESAKAVGEIMTQRERGEKGNKTKAEKKENRMSQYDEAYRVCEFAANDSKVTVKALADYFEVSTETIKRDIGKLDGKFMREDGIIKQVHKPQNV